MENTNYYEIVAIVLGVIALVASIIRLYSRYKVDNEMKKLILKKELNSEIEKYINIRNSKNKSRKRALSQKEYLKILNEINNLSERLTDNEKSIFIQTLNIKNEKNKLNYMNKLISESDKNKDNKEFEIIK